MDISLDIKDTGVEAFLKKYNIESVKKAWEIANSRIDVEKLVKDVQVIAFNNAVMAFALGIAVVVKNNEKDILKISSYIGEGLQAVCIRGSVADKRQVGIGHGNLAYRLIDEKTRTFCFLAGHESFAAAEGAISVSKYANSIRNKKLKVVLIGLGKDAAYIISRINGFTYRQTEYDNNSGILTTVKDYKFGNDERAKVIVYGADSVDEGVAMMQYEKVQVSITGNSTNPVRFTHPVAGIYSKLCFESNFDYFSVASGGGTGRTLHPDNVAAGPASYGLTDTMGRMHSSAQFAGSSSVPAHVNMMGFIGMGNNPIVGACVKAIVECKNL